MSKNFRHLSCLVLTATTLGVVPVKASPNILSVVERGGDTDRPSAMATGVTFDIQNPTGTVLVPSYTVGTFGENAKAMTDRVHDYNAASGTVPLPSYLVGKEYIMIANNNRDNAAFALDITIAHHSLVYLLIDNRLGDNDNANPPDFNTYMKWVSQDLWVPVSLNGNQVGNPGFPDTVGIDENADGTINQFSSVYLKIFPAGTFTLNEFGEGGRNMYGVVVAGIPEPAPWALMLLGGGALALLRRRHPRP